jgi:hypothetical protein
VGPAGLRAGRVRCAGKRAEAGAGRAWRGKGELGRPGLGFWVGFRFSCFLDFPSLFFPKHAQTNLNSNSYALKQRKLMHQHECIDKLNLR